MSTPQVARGQRADSAFTQPHDERGRICTLDIILEKIRIMAWVYLVIAGLLEIGWAIGLKYTQGFTRLWPSVATILAMIASFGLLAQALKTIPVGTGCGLELER
jgi:hypothetical protein